MPHVPSMTLKGFFYFGKQSIAKGEMQLWRIIQFCTMKSMNIRNTRQTTAGITERPHYWNKRKLKSKTQRKAEKCFS